MSLGPSLFWLLGVLACTGFGLLLFAASAVPLNPKLADGRPVMNAEPNEAA